MVIAILDTGIQKSHLAFKDGTILEEESRQFCDESCDSNYNDSDPKGHGTFIAGIAAGRPFTYELEDQGETKKIEYPGGVAKGAKLIICKVAKQTNKMYFTPVIKALQHIIDLQKKKKIHVHVVSMSLGFEKMKPEAMSKMQDMITTLTSQGTICVAAAGNENIVLYPARFESTIAVGSHDQNKDPSSFSASRSHVCCLAPGENICAPAMDKLETTVMKWQNGTSVATPAAAGLVSLIIQKLQELKRQDLVQINIIRTILENIGSVSKVLVPMKFFYGISDPKKYLEYMCTHCV